MGKHDDKKKCSYCGGSGKITIINDGSKQEIDCPHCAGTGRP